ncbi:MAG: SUMF1/EgtB/PvdO family nonheme iron enzyme [Planctomycetaceae bacterium]
MLNFPVRIARLSVQLALFAVAASGAMAAELAIGLVSEQPAEGRSIKTDRGYMVPYTVTIPGTDVSFEMVPIPGGTFQLGSAENEPGHQPDEGPQVEVRVEPFWMARTEVTWAEYRQYMRLYQYFKRFESAQMRVVTDENRIDAITAPTELYEPSFTFEYGDAPELPAVTMTQIAAKHYSKWMSRVTGQQFRLPSEAEWEYACRAGTTTAYSFGDDPELLKEFGWFRANSDDGGQHPVAQLKPNPWGLYDMHGNVAEWVLDAYSEEGHKWLAGQKGLTALETIGKPEEAWPRIVKGGGWDSKPEDCRSAARLASIDPDWKANDPNLPLSPWWFTDDPARMVGFRLVRSLNEVPREEMEPYWRIDTEDIAGDVEYRLEEGRGVLGIVDEQLPAAMKQLDEMK